MHVNIILWQSLRLQLKTDVLHNRESAFVRKRSSIVGFSRFLKQVGSLTRFVRSKVSITVWRGLHFSLLSISKFKSPDTIMWSNVRIILSNIFVVKFSKSLSDKDGGL